MNRYPEPLVSVVVPIYKVENYLRQCVDSILAQSYSNLQVILVDDGSPDGCPEIIDSYATKDDRIVCIHKPNGGLSSARNAGKEIARGEYIVFIDSDDYVHRRYVEILLRDILDSDADISACGFDSFIEKSCDVEISERDTPAEFSAVEAVHEMFRSDSYGWNAWNKMYRTDLFEGIDYPLNIVCEDKAVAYKLLLKARKVVYRKIELYHYRIRPNSISGTKSVKFYSDSLMINRQMEEALAKFDPDGLGRIAGSYTAKCGFLIYASTYDREGYCEVAKRALSDLKSRFRFIKYADYISTGERIGTWLAGVSAKIGSGLCLKALCSVVRAIERRRAERLS